MAGRPSFPVRGVFRLFSKVYLPRFHLKGRETVPARPSSEKQASTTQSLRFGGAGSAIASMTDCQKDAKQGQVCKAR